MRYAVNRNTVNTMGSNIPLDYMAIEPVRQGSTTLSFSVLAGAANRQLNSDYLRVVSFEGQESVSEPYSFTVTLRANEVNPIATSTVSVASDSDFAALPQQSYSTTDVLQLVQGTATALLGQWARVTLGNVVYPLSAGDTAKGRMEAAESLLDDIGQGDSELLKALFPAPVWQTSDSGATVADGTLPLRYFSGLVSSISQATPGEYTVVIQSPLYPLTLKNKYFIFEQTNIEGVIKALLQPVTSRYSQQVKTQFNVDGLAASRVQDWMQAGETDFAMLQRIMKKAAIHFYFIHDEDGVTIVFSNLASSPKAVTIPGAPNGDLTLRYSYTDAASLGMQQSDLLCNLSYQVQMTAESVGDIGTLFTRRQPVWETNNVANYESYPAISPSPKASYLHHRTFDYGLGVSAQSQGISQTETEETQLQLQQELSCQASTLTGDSTSSLLSPGYTFTLSELAVNPKDPVNNVMPAQFDGQTFVVTKIKHQASDTAPYSGSLEASPVPQDVDLTSPEATLITPFDIEDTSQGSVMAVVVKSGVPKNQFFLEKGNFDQQTTSISYDGAQVADPQMGCVVQFATDQGTEATYWVSLSESSQTVPAVNSIVQIGRGENESEMPQIQQVLASHGEKNIQPPKWKGNSWSFNTNWGSNCSTSYGDSLNIHFGNEVTPDLPVAMNIVKSAYLNNNPMGTGYGSASYDKGCSFNYSTTEHGASGLASASVSQGCHFSESYTAQDYSLSYTSTRQSYSETNKSVNVSYMGPTTATPDESNLSFINGRIPNQDIIDICQQLPDGSSYDQSHITGQTISLSGHGVPPPDMPPIVPEQRYSHSIFGGDSMDIQETAGTSTTLSTFVGLKTDTSNQLGGSISMTTFGGERSDTQIHQGDSTSVSTYEGNKTETSSVVGNSTTTSNYTGNSTSTSTYEGNKIETSSVVGETTTTSNYTGNTTSTSTYEGNKAETSSVTGDSATTSNYTGNSVSTSTYEGNKIETSSVTGDSNTTSNYTGDSTSTSTYEGAKIETSTVVGDTTTTSTHNGASETYTTINGAQISSTTIDGDSTSTTQKNGISTETIVKDGVATTTIDYNGASTTTNVGPASAHTDEREQAVQISGVNITVEEVLSIL